MKTHHSSFPIQSLALTAVFSLSAGLATVALAADAPDTAEVLGKLHESNFKEIHMGKMAQKNGKSKEVKAFGSMLVKDHNAAEKKVSGLAKHEKIKLPKAAGKEDMGDLGKGDDFDKKFAQAMLEDHKKDVAEAKEARDKTTNEKLKTLLTTLIPTLEKHQEQAQKLVDEKK
jgi:putative membrane protein